MKTFSELKSKYVQAITKQFSSSDEEAVCVLWQNEWVRILTVRDSDSSEKWRIEVEVSLPSELISTTSPQPSTDTHSGEEVKRFVQCLMKHLEYLLRLNDEGLTLGVMTRDGLWTAYLEIDDPPQDRLFKALIPPSV
ncbi:MAG: hypothetical protein ACXACG_05640 [Candidatus Thorarchaeota archaeon]|jgi:hypothetical protein